MAFVPVNSAELFLLKRGTLKKCQYLSIMNELFQTKTFDSSLETRLCMKKPFSVISKGCFRGRSPDLGGGQNFGSGR